MATQRCGQIDRCSGLDVSGRGRHSWRACVGGASVVRFYNTGLWQTFQKFMRLLIALLFGIIRFCRFYTLHRNSAHNSHYMTPLSSRRAQGQIFQEGSDIFSGKCKISKITMTSVNSRLRTLGRAAYVGGGGG